ncbi:hypothetical protein CKJ54_06555 [Mycobacterium marseillense]|uniref:Uncharacterized protein n=1 Tax=Mycobacterium marseillense TaxID=701042 RepID=A0AAC9VS56_9MYCO|nr:hypothetical protein CKJ54_06555 [Mycobacterium marseillense]
MLGKFDRLDALTRWVRIAVFSPLFGVFTPSDDFRVPFFDQLADDGTGYAAHQIFITDYLAGELAAKVFHAAVQLASDFGDRIKLLRGRFAAQNWRFRMRRAN